MTPSQIEAIKGVALAAVSLASTAGLLAADVAPAVVALIGAVITVVAAFAVRPAARG